MARIRLTGRDVEDVLAGRRPDARVDADELAEFVAVLHASRELEPPPPLSPALKEQIHRGAGTPDAFVVEPAVGPDVEVVASVPSTRVEAIRPARPVCYRRPVASVGIAAALLVGVVLATSRDEVTPAEDTVSGVGSANAADRHPPGDVTTSSAPATTEAAPPSTTVIEAGEADPPDTAGPPPSDGATPTTEGDQGGRSGRRSGRDGDRDGDGDGRWNGRWGNWWFGSGDDSGSRSFSDGGSHDRSGRDGRGESSTTTSGTGSSTTSSTSSTSTSTTAGTSTTTGPDPVEPRGDGDGSGSPVDLPSTTSRPTSTTSSTVTPVSSTTTTSPTVTPMSSTTTTSPTVTPASSTTVTSSSAAAESGRFMRPQHSAKRNRHPADGWGWLPRRPSPGGRHLFAGGA